MSNNRKKPTRLDFEVQLVSAATDPADSILVQIAGEKHSTARPSDVAARKLSGQVKLRREVKGRAGKPVTVLFGFSDPNASHPPSLKQLQAQLKEKLACGGTFDETECSIILQVDDLKRVRVVLEAMGLSVKS